MGMVGVGVFSHCSVGVARGVSSMCVSANDHMM